MPVLEFLKIVGLVCGPVLTMAVLLRAAVAIVNRANRSDGAAGDIKTPSYGWSIIVMAIAIVPCLGSFAFALPALDPPGADDILLSIFVGTPISVFVTGGILSLMLSTSYSRGIGVAFCMVVTLWTMVGVAGIATVVLAG
jgi:hypothetical protein